MHRPIAWSIACMGLAACLSVSALAEGIITIETLLNDMVNRETLARLPAPSYTCRQASSYDRDAVSPDEQDTWYANWDRSQFVRTEERDGRKEYVMFDEEGPGSIVRIWATWHGPGGGPFSNGTLRIYIDGQDEPAVEGPTSQVIDQGLLAGTPLSQGVSPETPYAQRGHNLYLPIPYARHCKVTYSTDVLVDKGAREGDALYYQINYRTYNDEVDVESFSMDRLAAAKTVVDATNKILTAGTRDSDENWQSIDTSVVLSAGSSSDALHIEGPGAIRLLQCRIEAMDVEQALRSTILEIAFDGERSVWCPIGEFFGTGYKPRPNMMWYTQVTEQHVMSCSWVMPFERNAVIRVHNLGEQPVKISDGLIRHSGWKWDKRSMHFHASWHQLTGVETRGKKEMNGQNAFDVNYVTVDGEGVYVGDSLTLCNGAAAWWGEGDEKVYVDGESFPSHFGTGTEDYYGYAWCRPEYFSAPFHAQPDGGGNLAGGYSSNIRYRALDAIPFSESIRFDFELWHWADTKINYAPTTYWYARPGAECNVQPDPDTARLPVAREKTDLVPIYKADGAIEGESLQVLEHTGGTISRQQGGFGWSGESQLWWRDADNGDRLVLEFEVEKAGRKNVFANLTKAPDYAIVKISINGEAARTLDRFHTSVAHDLIDLGTFELHDGTNRVSIEIVGKNPRALPQRMFGLDFLKVE